MTRLTKFQDAFWETDYCGTQGFDVLTKQMKVGRNTCRVVQEFFMQRASIEKDYAAKLQKWAKSVEKKNSGTIDFRTLDDALTEVIKQSENIALVHTDAAKCFSDRVEKLREFADTQKEEKKKLEETLKKSQNAKISQYNKMTSLQKQYHAKCQDRVQAKAYHESLQQSVTAPDKDKEKSKTKLEKAESEMEKADSAYKSSVDHLEQALQTWEKDMEEVAYKFQNLEAERVSQLRNELWIHCNTLSQLSVDIDGCCEQSRVVIEKCIIEDDILKFINENKTGSERPARVKYENYFTGGKTQGDGAPSRKPMLKPPSPNQSSNPGGPSKRPMPKLPTTLSDSSDVYASIE